MYFSKITCVNIITKVFDLYNYDYIKKLLHYYTYKI